MVYLKVKYLYGFVDCEAQGYLLELPREERYRGIIVYQTCINWSIIDDIVIGIACTKNGNYNQEEYERLMPLIEEYKAYHNFPNNKTIDLEVHGYISGDVEEYVLNTYNFNSPRPRNDQSE